MAVARGSYTGWPPEHGDEEELLKLLVGEVDAQLLERVGLERLEPEHVEQADLGASPAPAGPSAPSSGVAAPAAPSSGVAGVDCRVDARDEEGKQPRVQHLTRLRGGHVAATWLSRGTVAAAWRHVWRHAEGHTWQSRARRSHARQPRGTLTSASRADAACAGVTSIRVASSPPTRM